MASKTINVKFGQQISVLTIAPISGAILVSAVLAKIPESLTLSPVGLVLPTAPTALLAQTYDLMTDIGSGSSLDVTLALVSQFSFTLIGDSSTSTNLKILQYLPSDVPTTLAAFLTAIKAKFVGNTVYDAAIIASTVYGIARSAAGSVPLTEADTMAPGSYVLCPVYTYNIRIVATGKTITPAPQFRSQQTAAALVALAEQPTSLYIKPTLFPDDSSVTYANAMTKQYASSDIITAGSYFIEDLGKYVVRVQAAQATSGKEVSIVTYSLGSSRTPAIVLTNLDTASTEVTIGSLAAYGLVPDVDGWAQVNPSHTTSLEPGKYVLVAMTTVIIENGSADITLRAPSTITVEQLLKDQDVESLIDITVGAGKMFVLKSDVPATISPATLLSAMPSGVITFAAAAYANCQVDFKDSVGVTHTYHTYIPATDLHSSLKTLSLINFGLTETTEVKYGVFLATGITDPLDIYSQLVLTGAVTTGIALQKFVLYTMVPGSITDLTTAAVTTAFIPHDFTCGQLAKWAYAYKASFATALTFAGYKSDTTLTTTVQKLPYVYPVGDDSPPFWSWQLVKDVAPEFKVGIAIHASSLFHLISPDAVTFKALGYQSIFYDGKRMVQYARHVFPDQMAVGDEFVICKDANTSIPNLVVIEDDSFPLSAATTSNITVTAIKVKASTSVTLTPPHSLVLSDVTAQLPGDFTVWDVRNYCVAHFAGTTLNHLGLSMASDASDRTLGDTETITELQALYPSEDPLNIRVEVIVNATITITYAGKSIELPPIPQTCTVQNAFDVAAGEGYFELTAGQRFEAINSTIKGSDLISLYAKVPASGSSVLPVATFVVQLASAVNLSVGLFIGTSTVSTTYSLNPLSTIADLLTSAGITDASVKVTEVSSSKIAPTTSFINSFTPPYVFRCTQPSGTATITVKYISGTSPVTVALQVKTASTTVAQVITAAIASLKLDATKTYELALSTSAGTGAALTGTAIPDYLVAANQVFDLRLSSSMTTIFYGVVGVGALYWLLAA